MRKKVRRRHHSVPRRAGKVSCDIKDAPQPDVGTTLSMHSKLILIAFCALALAAVSMGQGLADEDMDQTQHEGNGRYARAAYHHDGGSGGGGGGGSGSPNGGHGDEVEYGAHTGDKGAFEWHAHYPVGHH